MSDWIIRFAGILNVTCVGVLVAGVLIAAMTGNASIAVGVLFAMVGYGLRESIAWLEARASR